MSEQDYQIIRPPRSLFKHEPDPIHAVTHEGSPTVVMERVEAHPTDGLLMYCTGAEYPRRGFPFPEAIAAFNIAKRNIISILRLLPPPVLLFVNKKKLIEEITELSLKHVKPYLLEEKYLQPVARELLSLMDTFMTLVGYPAEQLAEIMANIIENDDAYRYRIQDLMSETTKEELSEKPIRTIRRLIDLSFKRDNHAVSQKFRLISTLFQILLLIPKYRRAFVQTVRGSDFARLQWTDADKYWVMNRGDYNFFGETHSVRKNRAGQRPLQVQLK